MSLIVFAIGLIGGGLSGLLGIGGGIVTAPLLLYLPGLLGQEPLSMHAVGGLTISQALFASVCGSLGHWRTGNIDRRLAGVMSGVIFVAALAGGAASKWFSHRFLLGLFLAISLVAALLMLRAEREDAHSDYVPGTFSLPAAVGIALGVGLLGGLVGQAGSFVLIPLAASLLGVPLRVAMGSNMVIIFFGSLAGFVGKATTGQIPPVPALALLAGVLPGSLAGVALSQRVSTRVLRRVLAGLIVAACARMALDLMAGATAHFLPNPRVGDPGFHGNLDRHGGGVARRGGLRCAERSEHDGVPQRQDPAVYMGIEQNLNKMDDSLQC